MINQRTIGVNSSRLCCHGTLIPANERTINRSRLSVHPSSAVTRVARTASSRYTLEPPIWAQNREQTQSRLLSDPLKKQDKVSYF